MRCTGTYWDMILAVTIQTVKSDFPVLISGHLKLLNDFCSTGDIQRRIEHLVDQEFDTNPF